MTRWLALAVMLTMTAVGTRGTAHSIVKRNDDSDPLQAVVSQLSSDLQALQAQVTGLSHLMDLFKVKVGFATSIHHELTTSTHMTVKFDGVQYNEGNGYDHLTGIFTAPVAGMYSFFLKAETDPANKAGLEMVKEDQQVLYIFGSDPDSFQTPSGQVVLSMASGERVWVKTTQDNSKLRRWTRFGGFLVHPDV